MSDETTRDIFARLHAQEEEITALRRMFGPQRAKRQATTTRATRRRHGLAAVVLALLVALVPLSLLAANPFNDLTGGVHDENIDAIYNAGITTGCVPNVSYCPTNNVTREEMASFLARLGGLGHNKPVTNAARLATTNPSAGGTTYAANELVRVAKNSNESAAADDVVVLGSSAASPVLAAKATIETPGPGYLLVNADVVFRFTACPGCTVIAQISNGAAASMKSAEGDYVQFSLTWVLEVTEADTVDVPLLLRIVRPAQAPPGIPSGTYSTPHITALFVPFGATTIH